MTRFLQRQIGLLLVLVSLLVGFDASAHETRPLLWFDQGHGQAFKIDQQGALDLSLLATQLTQCGWQVETGNQPLTPKLLEQVDGLILSGAFRAYQEQEIAAIVDFLQAGKRVAIMLHIAPPYAGLLGQLGVVASNGVIRESGNSVIGTEPLNFSVTRLEPHPLTAGVETLNLFGAWALLNHDPQVRVLAQTSPQSWIDLNGNRQFDPGDARQSFAVLLSGRVGTGEFVVFGDDALFQNRFIHLNRRLAENLCLWLGRLPTGELAVVGQ
jgi:hypothetical protein